MHQISRIVLLFLLFIISCFMLYSAIYQTSLPFGEQNVVYLIWLAIGCVLFLIAKQWKYIRKDE